MAPPKGCNLRSSGYTDFDFILISGGKLKMSTFHSSPLTGVIEENLVLLDFGKYEGRAISDIAELDPGFYNELIALKESGKFSIRRHKDKTFRLYMNPLSSGGTIGGSIGGAGGSLTGQEASEAPTGI